MRGACATHEFSDAGLDDIVDKKIQNREPSTRKNWQKDGSSRNTDDELIQVIDVLKHC